MPRFSMAALQASKLRDRFKRIATRACDHRPIERQGRLLPQVTDRDVELTGPESGHIARLSG